MKKINKIELKKKTLQDEIFVKSEMDESEYCFLFLTTFSFFFHLPIFFPNKTSKPKTLSTTNIDEVLILPSFSIIFYLSFVCQNVLLTFFE